MWQLVQHYYSENYAVFWLADFFHRWPHVSYKGLKKQNPTFDPSNEGYVESLIFWAGVPILWLLLTLLVALLFCCILCCRRKRSADPSQPRPGVKCPQRFLIIASFICLGLLGLGYYGNEAAAIGVHHFINSADAINDTVSNIDYKVNEIENDLGNELPEQIRSLEESLRNLVSNQTVLNMMLSLTTRLSDAAVAAAGNISDVSDTIGHSGLDASLVLNQIEYYDYFRWMGIILVLTFQLITCLIVLLAATKASRYLLVFSSILCIVCLLIAWCLVALELFVSVGLGDLCVDPGQYLITEARKRSEISQEVLVYYIQCADSLNPFSSSIAQANNQLAAAKTSLTSISNLVTQYAPTAEPQVVAIEGTLQNVTRTTQQVTALVDCTGIHKDYISAAHGVCYDTLAGLGFLLLSGIILGLVLTLMLCVSSTLASRIAKRKINYEVDQEDPFLPPQTSTATLERFRRRGHESVDSSRETPSPISPGARPHSSHGFGPYDMASSRPLGRASYVSHQRDSFLEDPGSRTGGYDSPPPTYTMAMRRDQSRRNADRSSSEIQEENERNRNRLSAGSASLV